MYRLEQEFVLDWNRNLYRLEPILVPAGTNISSGLKPILVPSDTRVSSSPKTELVPGWNAKGDKMPVGKELRSGKWRHVIHLYDDGEYSAIWGKFISPFTRCLGVRWKESFGAAGYPSHGQYPLWFAEPPWLARMILLDLADKVNQNPAHGNLENILTALKECPEGEQMFEAEKELRSMKNREKRLVGADNIPVGV